MALFAEQTHDRLGITLIIAFIIHAVVIFAIKFDDLVKQNPVKTTRLEVTLAKRPSAKTPDEFDYLAQANQEGGGESDESDRPTDNNTAITPDVSTGAAPFQSAPKPAPDIPEEKRYIKTQGDDPSQTVQPQDDVTPVDPVPPAEIEYKQMDTAQLEALYYKQKEAYAKRSRIKSINANTKEAIYASYLNGWVEQVERFGNLNYPDESRIQKLYGDVLLEIMIRADGKLMSVKVIESSGHVPLDDAASRIVRLAAPFKPFRGELKKKQDALRITRLFRFERGNRASIR